MTDGLVQKVFRDYATTINVNPNNILFNRLMQDLIEAIRRALIVDGFSVHEGGIIVELVGDNPE